MGTFIMSYLTPFNCWNGSRKISSNFSKCPEDKVMNVNLKRKFHLIIWWYFVISYSCAQVKYMVICTLVTRTQRFLLFASFFELAGFFLFSRGKTFQVGNRLVFLLYFNKNLWIAISKNCWNSRKLTLFIDPKAK